MSTDTELLEVKNTFFFSCTLESVLTDSHIIVLSSHLVRMYFIVSAVNLVLSYKASMFLPPTSYHILKRHQEMLYSKPERQSRFCVFLWQSQGFKEIMLNLLETPKGTALNVDLL